MTTEDAPGKAEPPPECFVIMPISDFDPYPKDHFRRVYDDIFVPACEEAGFSPIRADKVSESNFIHLDILKRLIESPLAVCDLSGRNPNVLFELGIRQAFDKPVLLVRDDITQDIFDITPLRWTGYRRMRVYDELLHDRERIRIALRDTWQAHQDGKGVNSIVRLMALEKGAALPDIPEASKDPVLRVILEQLDQLGSAVRALGRTINRQLRTQSTPSPNPSDDFSPGLYHALTDSAAEHLLAGMSDNDVINWLLEETKLTQDQVTQIMLSASLKVRRERWRKQAGPTPPPTFDSAD